MRLVFDLDGTLVRTREANQAAYASIGVDPPIDFDVRPWQEWCSPEDHARKVEVFPKYLATMATTLPTLSILRATGGSILTNCHRKSWEAIKTVFPELRAYVIFYEKTPDEKISLLNAGKPGVYFDDSPSMVRRVREETAWQAIDTSGF